MLIFSIRNVASALRNMEPVLQQPPWPNACHLKWSFISEGTFQMKKWMLHFYGHFWRRFQKWYLEAWIFIFRAGFWQRLVWTQPKNCANWPTQKKLTLLGCFLECLQKVSYSALWAYFLDPRCTFGATVARAPYINSRPSHHTQEWQHGRVWL